MLKKRQYMGSSAGFTLIELVIAMAIAAVVLFGLAMVVLQLFKIYQAGIQIRATQQSARVALETISRAARNSASIQSVSVNVSGPSSPRIDKICLHQKPNSTVSGVADVYQVVLVGTRYQLYQQHYTDLDPANCPDTDSSKRTALTGDDVTVYEFEADVPASTPNLLVIKHLTLAAAGVDTSDATQFNPGSRGCVDSPYAQFCSVTSVNTSVSLRQWVAP